VQRHDRRLVLAVVSAASFLLSFDLSGFVVAMPSIRVAFSATDGQLTWAQNAFALAGCAALPLVGVLGDRLGRTRVFCLATIAFLVSSVGCALAGDVVELTWWRGCQGIASAAFLAIGTALLRDVWGTEMGQTVGFLTGAGAVGMSLGPVLGGVLVDLASWRMLLLVEAVAGALLVVAACTVLLGLPMARHAGLDVVGASAASIAIAGAVVLVHLWQPSDGTDGGDVVRSVPIVAVVLASIAVFGWRQRTSPAPALPRAVAASASFRVMVVVGFLSYLGLSATAFFISLVAQSIDGWSALPVGLIMLPITVGLVIGTLIGPALARRRGQRFVIVLGYTACALGTLALLGLSTNAIGWTAVALGNAVSGLGAGMASPQALAYGLRGIDNRDTGAAASWLWVCRQWGTCLGFALLAVVAFGSLTLVIGVRLVIMIAAIAFVTSAVIARTRMHPLPSS